MTSQWSSLKPSALKLRRSGKSIRYIENTLGISKSTLSGWFKNILLTEAQIKKLRGNYALGLIKARAEAVKWHHAQKAKHIKEAKERAILTFKKLKITDKAIMELALSMLYLGEGTKKKLDTSLGNSDPLILRFFLTCLYELFDIKPQQIKAELHLRYDQNPKLLTNFWAKELSLPRNSFFVNRDIRTKGTATYPEYHGVCLVRCCHVAIQRELVFLSKEFCNKIVAQKPNKVG